MSLPRAEDDREFAQAHAESESQTSGEKRRVSSQCLHCAQPMPASEVTESFCCNGCRAAYSLIHGEGLDQYYDLRRRMGGVDQRAVEGGLLDESFIDLDAPRFWQSHVVPLPGGLVQAVVRLQGIHCAACVWLLERLPQIQPGVLEARVSLPRSTIELTWNPTITRLSEIAKQIARLGYRVHPMSSSSQERAKLAEQRRQLVQIGIAGACAGNVMLLALAIYAGEWTGIAAEHLQLLRVASAAVGMVSLLGPGGTFFRGAWAALRMRAAHMDIPIALGLGVGAVSGVWNTLVGHGELYYDSLAMLVFFLLIGRTLQARQQQAACEAVDLLQQLTPGTALRVRDGAVDTVAIEDIVAGDTVEVREGRTIPVDGTVVSGSSEIDTSLLTGESIPTPVKEGDHVTAGTLNRTRTIRVRADEVGAMTRIGQLVESIQRASLTKAPVVQWADRISGIFVVVVLILAVVVAVGWLIVDPSVWTDRVVALLIVACPCALGLATPLAIAVGLGKAARRGVLIKGGDTLQRLAQPGILVLDKTGTITEGKMKIVQGHGSRDALEAAAALEQQSQHPVAEAVMNLWRDRTCGERPPIASDQESRLGSGIVGVVRGRKFFVGNRSLMRQEQINVDHDTEARIDAILADGLSPLLVAADGVIIACAAMGDALRAEAVEVVSHLKARGWKIQLLSGDHPRIVEQAGKALGLQSDEIFGGVSPEGKLERIHVLKRQGLPVLMVGDGVNDAAALAASDIGIAVRGGAEASLQAADVYLAGGSLLGIEEIMNTAERTMSVIRRNSRTSLAYNITAISLAGLGWLHPLAAALLMPASSLTVVSVTLWGHYISRKKPGTAEGRS
ncbi:MAG: heavy metal translocating P-type ATPase [Pirellulales bacterium]